jgi:hypothetical protein
LIVLKTIHSRNDMIQRLMRSVVIGLLAFLLISCQNEARPTPSHISAPTPIAFVSLGTLLKLNAAPESGDVTTAGYLVVYQVGATLVDGLSFADDGTAQVLGTTNQIWLGTGIEPSIQGQLRAAGALKFAPARVRGRLEAAGAYGPGGSYRYQIISPHIEVITAQETTISDLLDHASSYENRLVRLAGGLITRDNSALLVEQLGAGGVPQPKARQLKLRAPLQDRALLRRLNGVSGGAIHFGQVQIEGFWQAGILIPLAIIPVSNA